MKKIVYILLSLVFFTLSFGSENLEEVRYKKIIWCRCRDALYKGIKSAGAVCL